MRWEQEQINFHYVDHGTSSWFHETLQTLIPSKYIYGDRQWSGRQNKVKSAVEVMPPVTLPPTSTPDPLHPPDHHDPLPPPSTSTPHPPTHLHDRVWSENLLLNLRLRLGAAHRRKVTHRVLRRNCLAGTRFAGHDDRLVLGETGAKQLILSTEFIPETANLTANQKLSLQ